MGDPNNVNFEESRILRTPRAEGGERRTLEKFKESPKKDFSRIVMKQSVVSYQECHHQDTKH